MVASVSGRADDVCEIGSQDQPVLQKAGDNLRIDWGYLYVAVPADEGVSTAIAGHEKARQAFAGDGRLPGRTIRAMPRAADDDCPVMPLAASIWERSVGEPVSRHLMLAYDDIYSIEYLGTKLRPYWRRGGMDAGLPAANGGRTICELEQALQGV